MSRHFSASKTKKQLAEGANSSVDGLADNDLRSMLQKFGCEPEGLSLTTYAARIRSVPELPWAHAWVSWLDSSPSVTR